MSQEVETLRYWGIEGVDYEVGEGGVFYRTEEQRTQASETSYKASHLCVYSSFSTF